MSQLCNSAVAGVLLCVFTHFTVHVSVCVQVQVTGLSVGFCSVLSYTCVFEERCEQSRKLHSLISLLLVLPVTFYNANRTSDP